MQTLNIYYQKMADCLLDIVGDRDWQKIIYKVVFYLPDESGQILSSEKVYSYFDGKQSMSFSSDNLSFVMEEFRHEFQRLQKTCWSTMTFEFDSDGNMNMDVGYEKIEYVGQ